MPPDRRGVVAVAVLASLTAALALPAITALAEPTLELAVPDGFSPNGDGRFDVATISVRTGGPAEVDLWIARPGGATVRTLASVDEVDGRATYSWRGLNSAGKRVADGRYRVIATAQDADGRVRRHASMLLDTKPPSFTWRGIWPEPLRSTGPVRFSFVTGDRFSETIAVAFVLRDATGRLVERVRAGDRRTGERVVSWDARAPGWYPVAPGLYRVAVSVTDELRNTRTGTLRSFRSHRPVTSRVIRRVEGAGRRVALTFDDCTYGSAWAKIVGALQASRAHGTFFCCGVNVSRSGSLARRTVALGNAIGSHTWDHRGLLGASEWTVRTEVRRDQAMWWKRARTTPAPLFRPPNGSISSTILNGVGREGFAWTVLWDVDPRDWTGISAGEIQRRVLSSARAGSIVVLHVKPQTAAALPGILRGLKARGLEPVTLPTLLRAGGLAR